MKLEGTRSDKHNRGKWKKRKPLKIKKNKQ